MRTGSASGLFSKKQYAANAAQRFMRKLCTERWREWTRLDLFLSSSLMHSIIYRLRSIILSHKGNSKRNEFVEQYNTPESREVLA